MPKGSFSLALSWTNLKLVKINCAVSGLKYVLIDPSFIGPTFVTNIGLNSPLFSYSPPHLSHLTFPTSALSNLSLLPHFLQTTATSTKLFTCPEASQTLGLVIIDPSIPTTSSLPRTKNFHNSFLILFFNSTPK